MTLTNSGSVPSQSWNRFLQYLKRSNDLRWVMAIFRCLKSACGAIIKFGYVVGLKCQGKHRNLFQQWFVCLAMDKAWNQLANVMTWLYFLLIPVVTETANRTFPDNPITSGLEDWITRKLTITAVAIWIVLGRSISLRPGPMWIRIRSLSGVAAKVADSHLPQRHSIQEWIIVSPIFPFSATG